MNLKSVSFVFIPVANHVTNNNVEFLKIILVQRNVMQSLKNYYHYKFLNLLW